MAEARADRRRVRAACRDQLGELAACGRALVWRELVRVANDDPLDKAVVEALDEAGRASLVAVCGPLLECTRRVDAGDDRGKDEILAIDALRRARACSDDGGDGARKVDEAVRGDEEPLRKEGIRTR